MRYEIKHEVPFTKKQLKMLKIDDSKELNGCLWYEKELIVINVGSEEFEDKNEEEIIDLFTKVDTHERLHYEIYKILDGINNSKTEERFVCLMTEQEKW